jgi:RNA polymerase sigma-70 factor (ECF subfamily)
VHDSAHRLPPAPTNPGPSSTREHRQLHRARRGDDSAFAGLVEHHDEILRSMAARLVGVEDMDQVLITAYVKAYRALPRLGDGASVHAWLYRITYMACLDVLRREWRRTNRRPRRPRREFPTAPSSRVSSAHPSVAPSRDALVALDDLPADQRAVLLLVDRHHVSLTDVGAMLDVHPRQIAGVLTRARAAFEPGNGPGDAGEPDWDPTTDQLPPATDWPGPTTDQLPPATDWPGPTTDRPDTATDSEATGPAPASPDPAPDPTPGPATNQDNRPTRPTRRPIGPTWRPIRQQAGIPGPTRQPTGPT